MNPVHDAGPASTKVFFVQSSIFLYFDLGMSFNHFCANIEHLFDVNSSHTFLVKEKLTKKLFFDMTDLKIRGNPFPTLFCLIKKNMN